MKYKSKGKIKALIAAGLISVGLTGSTRQIDGYSANIKNSVASESTYKGDITEFKGVLINGFSKSSLTLNQNANEFVSGIIIDGINVRIELVDGTKMQGTLKDLKITDVNFENFYIYNSQYIKDSFDAKTTYSDYEEKGYSSPTEMMYDDYKNQEHLNLSTKNCSVSNEYKQGEMKNIEGRYYINYDNCKKVWLTGIWLDEKMLDKFSSMPNLETLILTSPDIYKLEDEVIKISSKSLKNIIIDGTTYVNFIDKFDFRKCPNLEIVSISGYTQETDLERTKRFKKLKRTCFWSPSIFI